MRIIREAADHHLLHVGAKTKKKHEKEIFHKSNKIKEKVIYINIKVYIYIYLKNTLWRSVFLSLFFLFSIYLFIELIIFLCIY